MFGARRHHRYPLNLRLQLQLAGGELETTTEDVSLAGFSAPCPPALEEGASFGFLLTLPDGKVVKGSASAMRVGEDLAGFSAEFSPETAPQWESFLKQEQGSGGLWRMLSRYASGSGASDSESVRTVLEKGRFEALFKRESASVVRLHMVGENGEAWRVAFEKHPAESIDASPFATRTPQLLELIKRAATRLLPHDVFLRPGGPGHPLEAARVVELKRGGYARIVLHATNGKPSLMGLQGNELLAVEVDGQALFPFFDADDLERIAADTFRREADVAPPPAATAPNAGIVQEERFSARYRHAEVHSDENRVTVEQVREAMQQSHRVQTRTYGARTLRLFPDLWLQALQPGATQPVRGFAVEDGEHLCIFVLVGEKAPRVARLGPQDQLTLIREG